MAATFPQGIAVHGVCPTVPGPPSSPQASGQPPVDVKQQGGATPEHSRHRKGSGKGRGWYSPKQHAHGLLLIY
eukprot:663450-Amphidinium_carterae.1